MPGVKPRIRPFGLIAEKIYLLIGGQRLPLGDSDRPVWVGSQGDEVESLPEMPGYEDLLLGRDFVTQHGLVILIDGEQRMFSILAPIDSANRERRAQIREAFEPGDGS